MGTDPRVDGHITRDPHRRQVEPVAVSGRTQTGEWINRLYTRVVALEDATGTGEGGGTVDPNAPAPTKYTTGNLPLADAEKIGDWAVGSALPSLGDLQFQKDYNHWVYGSMANDSHRIDLIEEREKDYAVRSWVQSWVAQYYAPHDHKHPELSVDLTGYATESWVVGQDFITAEDLGTEMEPYADKVWVQDQGYLTADDLPEGGGSVDLTGYALKSEIPTDNKELVNGAGYMSAADFLQAGFLNGYATEAWVGQQGYITAADLPEPPEGGGSVDLTEMVYSTARVSDKETLVWAGQNQAKPVPDSSGSIGWAYRSAGDGTKAHWTLWSQDREAGKTLTLADVYSYSLVMLGKGEMPYLQVYTKRKNDGQDHGSTYRSKISYQLDGDLPAGLITLALATTAAETPLYANLSRIALKHAPPIEATEAEAEASPMSSTGPGEADEEISKVVLSTNSVAKEGEFDFMIASLVLHTKHGTYDTQLEFSNDGGDYATTTALDAEIQARKDGDTAASYQLQQAEKGLNAQIEANKAKLEELEAALNNLPSGGIDWDNLPELN